MPRRVRFETAKLASEIGYSKLDLILSEADTMFYFPPTADLTSNPRGDNYPAPVQSEMAEWLWINYEIFVSVELDFNYGYFDYKVQIKNVNGKWRTAKRSNRQFKYSYNESLEKGLEEAIKLIKKKKL